MTHKGSLEVICGCMYSGKTSELIRRVRRAQFANQIIQLFKPEVDSRNGEKSIQSHDGSVIDCIPVGDPADIISSLKADTRVVAIDEAQFFDDKIVATTQNLVHLGVRVVVAGLTLDFRGQPFGSMPDLLVRADNVTMLTAICVVCGEEASRTQRLVNGQPAHYGEPVILIGAQEAYEARCREHHIVLTPLWVSAQ